MQYADIHQILTLVAQGALSPEQAKERLGLAAVRDSLNGLTLDPQRELRAGMGEAVFAQGKTDTALAAAVEGLAAYGGVLASRVSQAQGALLRARFPDGCLWPQAGLFALNAPARFIQAATQSWPTDGQALVVSAGASDMGVALEAFGTLCFRDYDCGCITDVGVAGLHRLTPHIKALRQARVIIAVAGMEGALPGVLAGLTPAPIVAVPTSVGYGVGAHGFAALSTMLCTCVPGVAVVNIDNGFGAAAFAAKILGRTDRDF
ncbi:MAG: PurE-related protein [Candidatus Desulfovibrio kirbyi]|jgi:NCAIR mutase (PurE)-related protein|uniref:PurE-related protein n=1 Tax=Candidatus Desulfovibrio kirbyi TaxID=2696086 RepID=A0A6L2R5W9_9BACT|nr:nickel pincer cofactor biosynthesis protein LarB [Desulfovibrio sp.]GFH62913.1 MAG: PurE-related protein [Candidatus Desulfovibrio kirbyi]